MTPVDADLSGRTCVVTGASAGIGRAAAHEMARLGAQVVLAVRNPQKGEKVLRAIAGATGNTRLEIATVDFARGESIRTFARDLAMRHPQIHVLINNAGIWSNGRQLGPDGIELVWATNVLGYFLTTELLLPQLRAAGRARIVNVASRYAGGLDLTDVQFERRPWAGKSAYAQSKQANRMWTWALARRLEGTGVTANALHPGFVSTEIFHKGGGVLGLHPCPDREAPCPAAGGGRRHRRVARCESGGRLSQRDLLGGPPRALVPLPRRVGGRGAVADVPAHERTGASACRRPTEPALETTRSLGVMTLARRQGANPLALDRNGHRLHLFDR